MAVEKPGSLLPRHRHVALSEILWLTSATMLLEYAFVKSMLMMQLGSVVSSVRATRPMVRFWKLVMGSDATHPPPPSTEVSMRFGKPMMQFAMLSPYRQHDLTCCELVGDADEAE